MATPIPFDTIESIRHALNPYTAFITVSLGGQVGPLGTGLYFAVVDKYFLITAGHVPKESSKAQATLYLPSDSEPGTAFRMTGKFIAPKSSELDVAVYEISKDEREQLSDRKFARMCDCHYQLNGNDSLVAITGILANESGSWPIEQTKELESIPQAVFVSRFTDEERIPDTINRLLHHCIDADLLWAEVVDGERSKPETLKGLSGGAVWTIPGDPWSPGWVLRKPMISGIQSSVITTYKGGTHRYCKVIRWEAVLQVLESYYPSVAEVRKNTAGIKIVRR